MEFTETVDTDYVNVDVKDMASPAEAWVARETSSSWIGNCWEREKPKYIYQSSMKPCSEEKFTVDFSCALHS